MMTDDLLENFWQFFLTDEKNHISAVAEYVITDGCWYCDFVWPTARIDPGGS